MAISQSGPVLANAPWSGNIFNGEWVAARGGSIEISEPASAAWLARSGWANAADVAASAELAARAQPGWAATPVRERAEVLHGAAAYLQRNAEELAAFLARETGGTFLTAVHEVREARHQLAAAAALTSQPDGVTLPSLPGRLHFARRVPLGVIGVLSPFSFPLLCSVRVLAPALALGNGIVLAPDAQTPVSGGFILALAFAEAGLPKGVLQVLPSSAEAREALCSDPNVRMISFTGASATGRRIGELAGKHLKRLALQLGGKNSLIVLDDADLELAAKNVAWGAYLHQGQLCLATGRVLVQQNVVAELSARLVEKARLLPVGDPAAGNVALGPLINERQRDHVHALVSEAVQQGATLEAGGTFRGLFYQPTVLGNVRPSMRAFREEVLGPVASITAFASDQEAVALANDTEYAPAAAVLSGSIERALGIAERLKAALVHVNDQTVNDELHNPFGGIGAASHPASRGGPGDLGEYTEWRWLTVKNAAPPYPF